MTKKTPGPLAPPDSNNPRRKITALSYSCFYDRIRKIQLYEFFKKYLNNLDDKAEGQWQCGKYKKK